VALGDSFTFGYGVEDDRAWPALLLQAMPLLRVLNLGLSGAGAPQYVHVYETFGMPRHPKLVIVGVFAGNDFERAERFDRWVRSGVPGNYLEWQNMEAAQRRRNSLPQPLASLEGLLRRHSILYNLDRQARLVVRMWMQGEPRVFRFADGVRLQLLTHAAVASITAVAQPESREFQLVLQAYKRLQALTQKQGAQLLLVFLPSKEEVYVPLLGEPAPDYSSSLRLALERQGMATLDLTPAFRQHAAAGERLFFSVDGHTNQQGYGLIAQEILRYLKAEASRYGLQSIGQQSSQRIRGWTQCHG
jgi:lysophospholipase L1-like esterase